MKKFTARTLTITVLLCMLCMILASCANSSDKLVGKWKTTDTMVEFTADGQFLSNGNTEEPGYYDILSGGKVLIYAKDAREDGVPFKFRFKNHHLILGKLEYTPVKE